MSNEDRKERARQRAREWYRANKERALSAMAIYRDQHREELQAYFIKYRVENRTKKQASDRAWRAAHLERSRQSARAQYHKNPEPYIARAAERARQHPDDERARARIKNHRRRGAPLDATAQEYVEILESDPCCYCGERIPRVCIDHIEPIAAGGDSQWTNLTAACRRCNAAKSNKSLLRFLLRRLGQ